LIPIETIAMAINNQPELLNNPMPISPVPQTNSAADCVA
jgi:hypothetical protein